MRSGKISVFKRLRPALPLYFFTAFFVLLPLLYTVFLSFMTRTDTWAIEYRFTLENYAALLDSTVLSTFVKSLRMGVAVTALTVLLGYPAGLALASLPQRQQKTLMGAMTFTFWINSVVRIYGIVILLRADGILGALRLLYTYGGVIFAMVYALLPFMIYAVYSAAAGLDRSALEAARVLGASKRKAFLHVTLPRTARGLLSGITMTFIPSMGLIYISTLVGGGKVLVVGNLIEDQVMKVHNIPLAAALAVVLMLLTASVILLGNLLDPVRRRRRHSLRTEKCAAAAVEDYPGTAAEDYAKNSKKEDNSQVDITLGKSFGLIGSMHNRGASEDARRAESMRCADNAQIAQNMQNVNSADGMVNVQSTETMPETKKLPDTFSLANGGHSVSADKKRAKRHAGLPLTYVCIVLLFLYLPVAVAVFFSFNDSRSSTVWERFSLRWYETLFSDSAILDALLHSVLLGAASSLLAAGIAVSAALAFRKHRPPLSREVTGVSMIPILIPDVILGMVFLAYFDTLHMPFGFITLLIAHTAFCIPYCYLQINTRVVAMDPSPAEAARVLGAGPVRTFFGITLPYLMPGILSGMFISFAMSFDDVIISMFVTGSDFNTLPIRVYTQVKTGVTPEINALCAVMLAVSLLGIFLFSLIRRKSRTE